MVVCRLGIIRVAISGDQELRLERENAEGHARESGMIGAQQKKGTRETGQHDNGDLAALIPFLKPLSNCCQESVHDI